MIRYTIYIVDDEKVIRDGLTMELESAYDVKAFSSAEDVLDAINNCPPDLILLDIGLPGMNGIDALNKIKDFSPDSIVIMITAYEDIKTVVSAMKLGAYDYVVKPLHMESLEVTINNAFEKIALQKEVQNLQEKYLKENIPCFIGESNAIEDVMEFVGMVAKSPDTPILILGETGTGKELIASAIHFRSPNFKGPFVPVNCAAIPKDLIESELFGYEKGAFSGARLAGKKGLIEEALQGTLFLDEVGDLSLEAQSKLLRFLQEGEFYRLGGTKKIQVKTRVVSATNKNLDSMLEKDSFRKDLYFRLGVIKVKVPSLNDRCEDIMPLAKYFLTEFARKFDKTFTSFSTEAESALMEYNWTGNVRELKNLIERGVLVGKGPEVTVQDLGIVLVNKEKSFQQKGDMVRQASIPPEGIDLDSIHDSIEKDYIDEALKVAGGNESKAAKLVNLKLNTFRYRRNKLHTK